VDLIDVKVLLTLLVLVGKSRPQWISGWGELDFKRLSGDLGFPVGKLIFACSACFSG